MYNSIADFAEKGLRKIEKMVAACIKGDEAFSHLSQVIHDEVNRMEVDLIGEIYELLDKEIMECIARKAGWSIDQKNKEKAIEDIAGYIRYTYFPVFLSTYPVLLYLMYPAMWIKRPGNMYTCWIRSWALNLIKS